MWHRAYVSTRGDVCVGHMLHSARVIKFLSYRLNIAYILYAIFPLIFLMWDYLFVLLSLQVMCDESSLRGR